MDDESRSLIKKINAMQARQNFGSMIDQVFYRGDQFVIERDGRPMAAVIPLSLLEELRNHPGAAKIKQDTKKDGKRSKK
jgi:antitoxin (DNA-binding transcriptional repressor) of toxin-antitoxin stability system